MIDPEMVALLACPLSEDRPPLRQEGEWLICDACQMKFPIREGIPRLLPEEAVPIDAVSPAE